MEKTQKFKVGDNVIVYDSINGEINYEAKIKAIDKDGFARLVTDDGFVKSKIITDQSTDIKLKTNQ